MLLLLFVCFVDAIVMEIVKIMVMELLWIRLLVLLLSSYCCRNHCSLLSFFPLQQILSLLVYDWKL